MEKKTVKIVHPFFMRLSPFL